PTRLAGARDRTPATFWTGSTKPKTGRCETTPSPSETKEPVTNDAPGGTPCFRRGDRDLLQLLERVVVNEKRIVVTRGLANGRPHDHVREFVGGRAWVRPRIANLESRCDRGLGAWLIF